MNTPEITAPTITVSDQAGADAEIPKALADGPVHLRIEGMTGAIDLTRIGEIDGRPLSALSHHPCVDDEESDNPGLLSVTVSLGDRPCHPDHVRALRDQCKSAGVPFAFLSWGDWAPGENFPISDLAPAAHFHDGEFRDGLGFGELLMVRVGRERSGRTLDGRTWDE